jgi:hypothetical protein
VTVDVTNTGARSGTDVPQLYLGLPSPAPGVVQPPRQLRGFHKIVLDPGQTGRVSFPIGARGLSYWNIAAAGWRIAPGCYPVMVGHSSRDIALQATLAVGGASCPRAAAAVPITASGRACARRRTVATRPRGVRRKRVRRVSADRRHHHRCGA